ARFTRAFHGHETDQPLRYNDPHFGCLFWGGSQEAANGQFRIDLALHAYLAFNVAHNLYTSYRSFGHDLPAWLITGLAHWHARRVSPRFPTYDRRDASDRDARSKFWDWQARVPGLIKNEVFEPLQQLLDRNNAGAFGL